MKDRHISQVGGAFVGCLSPLDLYASKESLDLYKIFGESFGLDPRYFPLLSSLFVLALLSLLGFAYWRQTQLQLQQGAEALKPEGRPGLRFFSESILDFTYSIAEQQCGEKKERYFPFLCAIFLFILTCNLSGLIPGLPPATESFSANLALGALVFLTYNLAGLAEHGPSYVKQFLGPFALLAPLFLLLELISHAARPLSLSFRLAANIFGDHLLLSVFSGMCALGVPAVLLFFGLLVAVIQSFVFTMLTSVYLNMALSHDH